MKHTFLFFAALFLSAVLVLIQTVQADLVGFYDFETVSGTTVTNGGVGGAAAGWGTIGDGTVNGTVSFVADADRGSTVAQFTGAGVINIGNIGPVSTATTDFTLAFWGKSTNASGSNVVFGNRFGGTGNNAWIKFTETKPEYHPNNAAFGFDNYNGAAMSTTNWTHYMFVKDDNVLKSYVNGTLVAFKKITSAPDITDNTPFALGGDPNGTSERWSGLMDDARIYNSAVSYSDYSQFVTPAAYKAVPTPEGSRTLSFASQDGALDSSVWSVVSRGLQVTTASLNNYVTPFVENGNVYLGGACTTAYWDGVSVETNEVFSASADKQITVTTNRQFLTGTTNYRSSMWFIDANDANSFLHFGQNTENSSCWAWNADDSSPSGGGNVLNTAGKNQSPTDFGEKIISMTHDGSAIKMYIDGKFYASHTVDYKDFQVMLSAMGRDTGNTVYTSFAAPVVTTKSYSNVYDDFSSNSIGTKWTAQARGLENKNGTYDIGTDHISAANGVLTLTGNCDGSSYWYGYTVKSTEFFDTKQKLEVAVDREAVFSTDAYRSSVWLYGNDENWIMFGQFEETGWNDAEWQYNYSDNGTGSTNGAGVRLNAASGSAVADIADLGLHNLKMTMEPLDNDGVGVLVNMYVDDILAGTQTLANWDTNMPAYIMLTGSPRQGETVTAVFDNVTIDGVSVPEPATWAMLILGVSSLWFMRRRKN